MWDDFEKYLYVTLVLMLLVFCIPLFLLGCYIGHQLGITDNEQFSGYIIIAYLSLALLTSVIVHMIKRVRDAKWLADYRARQAEEEANRIMEEMFTARESEMRALKEKYLGKNAEV